MKRKIKFKGIAIILLLSVCLATGLFTYGKTDKSPQFVIDADGGIVRLITGDFSSAAIKGDEDILRVLDGLKDIYGYEKAASELALNKTLDTASGKVYRFDQIKDGFKVFGRGLNVSADLNGEILSVSGNYLKGIKIKTAPEFNEEFIVEVICNTYQDAYINSVNLEVYSLNNTPPVLAYNVTADLNGALTRIFIAADTGDIIEEISMQSNHIPPNYNTDIVSSTQTDYYGLTQSVDIEKQDSYYFLNDAYRNIILYDCENTNNPKNYFYSTEPVFNNGLAVTALLNTVKAFDYYVDASNIGVSISGIDNSVDGTHTNKEAFIIVCLHYGNELQNAFCSFDPNVVDDNFGRFMYLIFGDGHPSGLHNPVVASDIVGHEYQHAVTSYTAGLIYSNASGALNEAYSDIFGALIENRPQSDDNFWICGENATSDKKGLRSMKNPTDYGYPDHMDNMLPMDGNYDEGGVHHNSAIITHAQYKMYEALPSHFTKQNIGKLWYTALTMLSADSDFSDFKIIMRQAAVQLGWDESVLEVMENAFESCGIRGTEGAHTITFKSDGMTGTAPTDITRDYGEPFTIPECGLTAPRAKLAGWSETGNYKSTIYLVGQEYIMPAFDLTLYPVLDREIWNGIEPTVLSGDGTQNSPYLISTAGDLATVAYYFNNDIDKPWAANIPRFLMTADIDLENIPWIPIGNVSASSGGDAPEPAEVRVNFDGGGHVIRNLKISYENPDKYLFQGLFGAIGDIDILRLGIESGSIETAAFYVGAIAGGLRDSSVTDCFSEIDITNSASVIAYEGTSTYGSAGGIIGYLNGKTSSVTNCRNGGDINAYYAGGICALQYGQAAFTGCLNTGFITGVMIGGGIISYSTHLNVENCINTGEIKGRSTYIGGICGSFYGERNSQSQMAGCKNTGALSGWFIGGLIGTAYGSCTVSLEKNHYKKQDGLTYIGNLASLSRRTEILGDEPVCSDDITGQGDFSFYNMDYFLDSSYFCDISDESALSLYLLLDNINSFTVTWDIDGVIETVEYKFGEIPEYDGIPVKEKNARYSYSFSGWSPLIKEVKEDITYSAVFERTVNGYTVTFMSNGKIFDTQTVLYGEKLAETPVPERKGYAFIGWYKTEDYSSAFNKDMDTVWAEVTLYAKWQRNSLCACGSIDLSLGTGMFLFIACLVAAYLLKPRRKTVYHINLI